MDLTYDPQSIDSQFLLDNVAPAKARSRGSLIKAGCRLPPHIIHGLFLEASDALAKQNLGSRPKGDCPSYAHVSQFVCAPQQQCLTRCQRQALLKWPRQELILDVLVEVLPYIPSIASSAAKTGSALDRPIVNQHLPTQIA